MKVRIAKSVTRVACTALVALLLVSIPAMETRAAEVYVEESEEVAELKFIADEVLTDSNPPMARTALFNCMINVDCSSEGMWVDFNTNSSGTASVIGVKDIEIKKKVWYGWKTVATSSGGERENSNSYAGHILYEDAEYGETYRITCVHYADVDGYEEQDNQLDSFVFTY